MNLYEYAIIRFVPDIEREEFVNVGLIMMCKRRRWIRVATHIDIERIKVFCSSWDIESINDALSTFIETTRASRINDPMCELEVEERFRWLTAVKSACIATSRPHPGLCENLDETFETLFDRLIRAH